MSTLSFIICFHGTHSSSYVTCKQSLNLDKVILYLGIDVVDAAEYYFSKKKYPDWERPFPKDERWYVPTEQDDPDYKETPIYEFNTKSKLLEGTAVLKVNQCIT